MTESPQQPDENPEAQPETQPLTDVMDRAVDETEDKEKVSIGDILDSFGSRSYGPLLLVPSAIAMIPIIGAIPGISIITGTIILLISVQMLIFRSKPWLPRFLTKFSFGHKRLSKGFGRIKPWVRPIEKLIHRRLTFLTEMPFLYLIPIGCIAGALLFYPTAFIPWGVTVPGFAVLMLALGLTSRDGVLILIGYAALAGSFWLAIALWPF